MKAKTERKSSRLEILAEKRASPLPSDSPWRFCSTRYMKANNIPYITACKGILHIIHALQSLKNYTHLKKKKLLIYSKAFLRCKECERPTKLKCGETGAKRIWLTNRSSLHLNHHSWMLPCSSKSMEMGHTEKIFSKKPWSHNTKTWILHKEDLNTSYE